MAQIALALVILSGTGVMAGSFLHFAAGAARFRPRTFLTFHVALPKSRYATAAERVAFYRRALGQLKTLPGVQSAGLSLAAPYSNDGTEWRLYRGQAAPVQSGRTAVWQPVSPNYFRLMRVPLLRGRAFAASDRARAPAVAIVSRGLARRDWPGQNPLGQCLWRGKAGGAAITVVGVAADVQYAWTDTRGPEPVVYRPYAQTPPWQPILAARARPGAPLPAVKWVRAKMASSDPQLPVQQIESLAALIYDQLSPVYLIGDVALAMGLIALVLAAAGIYGVAAYAVNLRRREIGIRLALGAERRAITRQFLHRAWPLVALGLGLGAAGAWWNARLIAGLFAPGGPGAPLAAVAVILAGVALAASYWPARRAARLDPAKALREE